MTPVEVYRYQKECFSQIHFAYREHPSIKQNVQCNIGNTVIIQGWKISTP